MIQNTDKPLPAERAVTAAKALGQLAGIVACLAFADDYERLAFVSQVTILMPSDVQALTYGDVGRHYVQAMRVMTAQLEATP